MKRTQVTALARQLGAMLAAYGHDPEAAWWLIQKVTGSTKANLIASGYQLTEQQVGQLNEWMIQIIEDKKPTQYVLGTVPFLDLELVVRAPILIPRPETEEWVAWLIEQLQSVDTASMRILDIGTGTGCIAIALAHVFPEAEVVGVDFNPEAVTLARENAARAQVSNVQFIQSDLFSAFADSESARRFDLIVSNPPYIGQHERPVMDESVVNWEDPAALFAEDDGTALLKKIIMQASGYLRMHKSLEEHLGANVIIEIGFNQGQVVQELMKNAGYQDVSILSDYNQKDRVVMGRGPTHEGDAT